MIAGPDELEEWRHGFQDTTDSDFQPTAMGCLILDQFLYRLLQVRPDRPFDTHTFYLVT